VTLIHNHKVSLKVIPSDKRLHRRHLDVCPRLHTLVPCLDNAMFNIKRVELIRRLVNQLFSVSQEQAPSPSLNSAVNHM
jgi:hypothetical protein